MDRQGEQLDRVRRRRSSRRRLHARILLRRALTLGAVAAVFVLVVPRISSYGAVSRELAALSPAWAAGLVAAAALNILTFAFPWLVLLPGLRLPRALAFTQASTALVMVVPGGAPVGVALSFGILRRLRVAAGSAGLAVLATGVANQVAILLFPVVGVAAVLATGHVSRVVEVVAAASAAAAIVILASVAVLLRSREGARRLGNLLRSAVSAIARILRREAPGWDGDSLVRARDESLWQLRRRWPALAATTLLNQLTGYLLLELSLRAVGITLAQLPLAETFMAWSLGRLIGSLPLTPGGLGVVELGLIGTLVGFGGPRAHVVAAVLLYRSLIVVPTLVLGMGTLLVWRVRPAG